MPLGVQLRANTCTQSTTKRAKSRNRKSVRTRLITPPTKSTPRSYRRAGSALVEEAVLGHPLLVLRGDRDVRRRQQEDLVRDALDGPVDREHQAGSEVDQPLRIGVVHLREVHDHWDPLAEVLTDRP